MVSVFTIPYFLKTYDVLCSAIDPAFWDHIDARSYFCFCCCSKWSNVSAYQCECVCFCFCFVLSAVVNLCLRFNPVSIMGSRWDSRFGLNLFVRVFYGVTLDTIKVGVPYQKCLWISFVGETLSVLSLFSVLFLFFLMSSAESFHQLFLLSLCVLSDFCENTLDLL